MAALTEKEISVRNVLLNRMTVITDKILPNVVYGANQPEYIPLPAEKRPGRSGEIVTCWELNQNEMKIIQETGKIWLSVLTFGQPLQPVLLTIDKPDVYDKD